MNDVEFEDALKAQVEAQHDEPVAEPEPVEPVQAEPQNVEPEIVVEHHPSYEYVPPSLDEIDEDPQRAAVMAIQGEDAETYEAAMAEWYDQDAVNASRFERALEREMDPALQAVRQQQAQKQVVDAFTTLSEKYPDFQETLESATEADLAGIDRGQLAHLAQTNPTAALELAYRWTAGGRAAGGRVTATRRAAVRTSSARATSPAGGYGSGASSSVMERLAEAMLTPDAQSVRDHLQR